MATLAAWGFNDDGELGNGSISTSPVPVAVDTSVALAGKRIASLSAGQYHTLALCTDSTLVAWGYNHHGQLGTNSLVSSKVPVAIGSSGVLAGRSVVAVRARGYPQSGIVHGWHAGDLGLEQLRGVGRDRHPAKHHSRDC